MLYYELPKVGRLGGNEETVNVVIRKGRQTMLTIYSVNRKQAMKVTVVGRQKTFLCLGKGPISLPIPKNIETGMSGFPSAIFPPLRSLSSHLMDVFISMMSSERTFAFITHTVVEFSIGTDLGDFAE